MSKIKQSTNGNKKPIKPICYKTSSLVLFAPFKKQIQ